MRILANLNVAGTLDIDTVTNAGADTDRFLVQDATGLVRYRTGAEVASDIGASVGFVSTVKHLVKLGENISKGQAVYVSSADGTNMIVSKASNASEGTSSKTLGLLETGGVTNDQVYAVTEGLLAGLDTSTANVGDPVWLGTNGDLIFGLANKPYAPAHLVFIGIVTRKQQQNGEIFVKVQNGFELQELHNVQITTTPANNTVLAYETSSSLYKMKSIATLLGYTPADDAGVVHLAGTETITGTKTFTAATTTFAKVVANSPAGGATGEGIVVGKSFKLDASGEGESAKIYVVTKDLSDTYGSGLQIQFANIDDNKGFGFNLNTAGGYEIYTKDAGAAWVKAMTISNTQLATFHGNVRLAAYTTNGFVKTSSSNGTITIDPAAFTLTTTGTNGPATYNSGTGVLNIPEYLGASGIRIVYNFTATAGQTTFTVTSYTPGVIDVYYNGSRLTEDEYTATNGTTIVLDTACAVGDLVDVIVYQGSINGFTGVGGSGTINQLTYWTGANTIGALSTATYPSLTEISYVKGVTSAIQTQLDAKVPTSRTLTINGTSYDLSANRSWTISGVTGSGTANQIAYWDGSSSVAGSTFLTLNLAADNGYLILTGGATYKNADIWLNRYSDAWENAIRFQTNGTTDWYLGSSATGSNSNLEFYSYGTTSAALTLLKASANANFGASVGIGNTTLTGYSLRVSRTMVGDTASGITSFGVVSDGTVQSAVTSGAFGFNSALSTAAAAFTLDSLIHFRATQGTIGNTSAVTNQYGFAALGTMTGATNNYGFFGSLDSATGRWNLYMSGTARNYLAGDTSIGTTTGGYKLNVSGTANISGVLTGTTGTFSSTLTGTGLRSFAVNTAQTPSNNAGWYTLARFNTYAPFLNTNGNSGIITLSFYGGGIYTPSRYRIFYFKDDANVATLKLEKYGAVDYIQEVRIRYRTGDTRYYIEIYCDSHASGLTFDVHHDRLFGYGDQLEIFGGVLDAASGTGTILATLPFVDHGTTMSSLNVVTSASFSSALTANSFVKSGGIASQFLKADGTVDSSTYLTAESDTLATVTGRGATSSVDITINGVRVGRGAGNDSSNTVLGNSALGGSTASVAGNTAIGCSAMSSNTSGFGNTALGFGVLDQNTTGQSNTAIGVNAGQLIIGSYNTFVGRQAFNQATSGNNNTIIGYAAGIDITSGSNNTLIGGYTGPASALSGNVIISDGSGNIRFLHNGTSGKLPFLTSNGFVKTSGGDGTLSVDTNTYLTSSGGNLTGDITLKQSAATNIGDFTQKASFGVKFNGNYWNSASGSIELYTGQIFGIPNTSNVNPAPSTRIVIQPGTTDTIYALSTGVVRLPQYTTNGFVKFSNSDGTLSVDNNTYLTAETDTLASVTGRGASTSTAVTFSGGITVSGTGYYTFNKPSTSQYQTVALFGTTGGGIFITSDNAIISKGAYYNNGWIATATAGSLIDFTANSNNPGIATFSGATVGSAASFSTTYKIWHEGNLTNLNQLTNGPGYITGVSWSGITGGTRTNYNLDIKPTANGYAGFSFTKSTSADGSADAGYFLVRGTSNSDIYTAEGITLVADAGWLTLAQRTSAGKGVRIITGSSSTAVRASFETGGNTIFYVTAGGASSSDRVTIQDGGTNIDLVSYAGSGNAYSASAGIFVSGGKDALVMAQNSSIRFVTGSYTEAMRVDNSQLLLVGYTSNQNSYKVQVNGAIYSAANIFSEGAIYAATYTARNNRVSNSQRHPLGHHNDGDTVFSIDPTWSQSQLQDYFNSASVYWDNDTTAPGGYSIRIDGQINVGSGPYSSGFPYIPVESSSDMYYMECWIKNEAGSTISHYMGGIDYDNNFSSLGGNPGSFTYNVMSNYNPGTSWTKVYGYWSGFGSGYGGSGTGNTNNWVNGTKYFTPQALFNYGFSGGTRRCYISGWKCIKVRNYGNRYFSDNIESAGAVYASNWFRTFGNSGWYSQTYGGGMFMQDTTWVRVYGGKQFYVENTGTNAICAQGDIVAYYSDERLKEKTGRIENALDKILRLNGFYYKENNLAKSLGYNNDKIQIGLSAQEVKLIAPEIVGLAPFDMHTEENGTISSKSGQNYLTVKYDKLVPILVEAIKELAEENKQIKEELSKLKN